ncbi:MAG TPA: HAMP domain-containing sensor histidine kinase [Solirubrobacterales bacterium]|jgi:signal transduction histidine kinase|nr:HAMP domain-containing sensor histidine kinase [Solirubrobacterales bacterium]
MFSPSLANRLTIGFAIAFAVLTGLAVIGVARFIQQRQDYENATARSYQREIQARNQLARGVETDQARQVIVSQHEQRETLTDEINAKTRDTALLVGVGLIAGLTGAALLFSGLISSMRRPLDDLVAASKRLAAGDLDVRVKVGGLSETAALGTAFNNMAEELQRQAGERDQLDRMKDEFVLTTSHELRSPLTAVQGFAELLMLERERLTAKQAETVEVILDNSRHLVRLLNDLLDLARSNAGRLTIKPVLVEPSQLVEEAVRTMRGQIESKHQTLSEEIEHQLPYVNADADRIRQVLVNLLTNANEYCPEGADIAVEARRIETQVEIAVTDDGPGIQTEQLDLIFERFTRGEAGLTQRVGGTGLGLAISKSLVELHGGTIWVESRPGDGATFRMRLPAAAAPDRAGVTWAGA